MIEATLAASQPQRGLVYTFEDQANKDFSRFREESSQSMTAYIVASVVGFLVFIAFWFFVIRYFLRRHTHVMMLGPVGYIHPMGNVVPMGSIGKVGTIGHATKGLTKA